MMEKTYTYQEVADIFKVTHQTIIKWKKSGKLPYIQINRRVLFKESDIKKLIDEYTHVDKQA